VTSRSRRRAVLRAALGAGAGWATARAMRGRSAALAALAGAAAGTAQEDGAAAVVPALVLVAAAGRRREAPSTVAEAVAVGVGASLATRAIWPVAPDEPAQVRPPRRLALDPAPGGEGLTVVVNPSAGAASGGDVTEELARVLPAARTVTLDDPGELVATLERAASEPGTRALGVAGGDGSINAAAGVAAAHGIPLAVVPGGTLNHLARDLGLVTAGDVAAAVEAGDAIEVDLPAIDGRRFVNTASFGSYAELVDARESLEERLGKWPAMLVALVRVLRRGSPVEVELDGRRRLLWMIFVGNCRYRPAGFAPTWRERLDDGELDVRMVDAGHPWCRTRLVVALLTGQLGRSAVYDHWRTTALVVRSEGAALRLACDGETFDASGPEVVIAKDGTRVAVFAVPAAGPGRRSVDAGSRRR
jgi:diacylglycerol kinase family enzyme